MATTKKITANGTEISVLLQGNESHVLPVKGLLTTN